MTAVEALTTAPLVEIARSLRRRQVSPLDLVDAYSRRIEQASGLRAFITLPGERARREARRAERRLARGEAGALLGVPIAVKDLFATRGIRTTAGSRILRDWVPARDAAAVAQLRAAGAIIFGKTNLHEFAYGVSTANPWWGVARNPHDPTRSPGGSSGGSAIAVVAGLCAGALGSDTGGSIRVPASLCGCVGLKPTFGAIPLVRTRPRAYGADVRIRLQLGALVAGADYVLAQRVRGRLRAALERVFQDVDVLLLPTTPITAPVIGDRTARWRSGEEPVDGALVRLTAPFNLTGLPALSVPFGRAGGLPVGLQVVGQSMDEARLLAVGRVIEELAEA